MQQESVRALEIIQKRMAQGLAADDKIAVLVRSRGRLRELIPLLNHHQIPFSAVDIFELSQESIIRIYRRWRSLCIIFMIVRPGSPY